MDPLEIAQRIISDDSDDDDFEYLPRRRRPRFIRERLDHFADLDDVDFVRRFRLSKRMALQVLDLIDHRLEFPTDKNDAVSPINQLLLCLRFYATGCTQLSAADFSGVSEATANRIVHRVTAAIAALYRQYIYFPRTQAETQQTQRDFYVIARFPRVVGAVDCTHIKIRSPGGENAEYFRNRKGYMSISCQGICNANLEFLDVVARWPGSSHDQTVFDSSLARARIERNDFGDVVLLGDSAYSDRKYLMTPLETPVNPEEVLYNESQIRTRNPVERIFGVWKRRFPILALGINVHLRRALPIIVATAVLYNILRRAGDPDPPDDNQLHLPMPWDALIRHGQVNQGQNARNNVQGAPRDPFRRALINDYFRTLNVVHGN